MTLDEILETVRRVDAMAMEHEGGNNAERGLEFITDRLGIPYQVAKEAAAELGESLVGNYGWPRSQETVSGLGTAWLTGFVMGLEHDRKESSD